MSYVLHTHGKSQRFLNIVGPGSRPTRREAPASQLPTRRAVPATTAAPPRPEARRLATSDGSASGARRPHHARPARPRPSTPHPVLTQTGLGGARSRRLPRAALGLSLTISLLWPGAPAPRLSSEPPSPRHGPDVEAESPPSGRGNAEEEAGTAPQPRYRGP